MLKKNSRSNHGPIDRSPVQQLKNQRGQGLIEYLIIVALMGVATIAIIRTMGEAVSNRFAAVTHALQGNKSIKKVDIDEGTYKKKDMGNFFDGVEGKERK